MRSSRITLLAALESKNGKRWVALYEDNSFSKPTYYYTSDTGGENLGLDKRDAAAHVVQVAGAIRPKVTRLELTPEVIQRYA